jgi:glucosamine--fructose-6-phosphate aminotransferase (isomerizing)
MICSIGARTQPELAYLAHSVTPNLEGLALAIDNALSADSISGLTSIAELLSRMSVVVVAGSGFDHVVALEGALKLKEAASVHSEGTHVQNLVHGGIVSLNPETGIIILASSGRSSHPAQNLARACKQTGALVILLGGWGSIDEAQECDRTVVLSTTLEQPLSSLATMATLDMIACLVASFRDLNPDDFRKSLPGFKKAYALLDT